MCDRLSTAGQPPLGQRPAFGDFIAGMSLAGGIAAALFQRERTGHGVEVDVSLLGTAIWVLSPDITAANMYGTMLPSAGEMPRPPNPLVGTYECADGKRLVLMMLQAERFWPEFASVIERPDLLTTYATPDQRRSDAAAITSELQRHFSTQPRAAWITRLEASSCIWGPFQTPLDLADDPQVQANGYFLPASTSDGPLALCANPVQFGGEPPVVRWPAEDVGASTEAVLLELGLSWDDLGPLKEKHVIP